jgi:hypothetical protein
VFYQQQQIIEIAWVVTHTVSVPFVPAFGNACCVTVTVAVALTVHGDVANTVYV